MSLSQKAIGACAAGLALILPIFTYQRDRSPVAQMGDQQQRNTGAFATILGEFRTNIGDMLFVKTERYLDSGIAYAPHATVEDMTSSGHPEGGHDHEHDHAHEDHDHDGDGVQDHAPEDHKGHDHAHEDHDHDGDGVQDHAPEDHHDHDHAAHDDHSGHDHSGHEHAGVPTLIRSLDDDFRGFIGRMERLVKPWRDPKEAHEHTTGEELLPWYRLASLSDPHNVRTYVIGSWWLKTMDTPEQRAEALRFTEEGITNNPEAYALHLMRGYILFEDQRTTEALAAFERSSELGVKHRPEGGKTTDNWDETDEEQVAAAISMAIFLIRDNESTASAKARLNHYRPHFPSPSFLDRVENSLNRQ